MNIQSNQEWDEYLESAKDFFRRLKIDDVDLTEIEKNRGRDAWTFVHQADRNLDVLYDQIDEIRWKDAWLKLWVRERIKKIV